MLVPVIMSGGAGTRLWPLSRKEYPKQFFDLVTENTMIQDTALRLKGLENTCGPVVVCNEAHRFLVSDQLKNIGVKPSAVILEPCPRNTAPAIALAAFHALAQHENPTMLVMASDHEIKDTKTFQNAAIAGLSAAEKGYIVTFGIVPDRAETGYGYIKAGKSTEIEGIFKIDQFTEKPDIQKAQQFLDSGDYYWNSGMFMVRADNYLAELKKFSPDIYKFTKEAYEGKSSYFEFCMADIESFEKCPSDSIDYAVMEKTNMATVIPLDAGWSDVGSWQSLWLASERDENGNSLKGDVIVENCENCLVQSSERFVSAIGLKDCVVVETADAVFVSTMKESLKAKDTVDRLNEFSRKEAAEHTFSSRPWGNFKNIDESTGFKVKRIKVKPGARLSLQKHFHRSEHWIVVTGTALVTCGEKEFTLTANESTYIPKGEIHRLENPGKLPLEIIEVQVGEYLGEDDIVRIDDDFKR